jgi:hypothetical protein
MGQSRSVCVTEQFSVECDIAFLPATTSLSASELKGVDCMEWNHLPSEPKPPVPDPAPKDPYPFPPASPSPDPDEPDSDVIGPQVDPLPA